MINYTFTLELVKKSLLNIASPDRPGNRAVVHSDSAVAAEAHETPVMQ
jgi:hypothetical protein